MLVAGCWLLVAGCWLRVAGCWLRVARFGLLVEHGHDGLGRAHGALKAAVHVGESAHRAANKARINNEAEELP
ncbi:MAG: hypothetical protein ACKOX0_00330 [Bacteroidota bacterium]